MHPLPELGVAPASPRSAWLEAPMPGATLCRIDEAGLRDLLGGPVIPLSTDLRAALLGEAREHRTRLARTHDGGGWRVRCIPDRGGAPLWLAQSIADSRGAIASLLRSALARRLAGNVLHELRNPMNAISLYADVLAMLMSKPPGADVRDKTSAALKSLRERLGDLNGRMSAATELWIGSSGAAATAPLSAIWREAQRLVNGYFTLNAIPFEVEGAELLEQTAVPRARDPLELVLIGLVMMAADAAIAHAEGAPARRVRLRVEAAPGGGLAFCLDGPLEGLAFVAALGGREPGSACSALSLLLDDGPAEVSPLGGGGLRLQVPST